MSGFRKLKCFILWNGVSAAGCPPCSGPRVQCMLQHRGMGSWKCPGQDEILWSATESNEDLKFWFSYCLVKWWEVYFPVSLSFIFPLFLETK